MFVNIVNRHAPLQKMTRKEQDLTINHGCLSIALKKSINIKNKMFHSTMKNNSDIEQHWLSIKNIEIA